jgi:hypothetical protein
MTFAIQRPLFLLCEIILLLLSIDRRPINGVIHPPVAKVGLMNPGREFDDTTYFIG